MSELLPLGVESIRECPWRWFEAIRLGMFFIGFEELAEEDRPPRKIWLDSEAMESHFAALKAKRERESKGDTTLEGVPVQNSAARDLIAGG